MKILLWYFHLPRFVNKKNKDEKNNSLFQRRSLPAGCLWL